MRRLHAIRNTALALASLAVPRPAFAQATLEHIRLAGPISEDLTSLYYAMKTGIFARNGLEIELEPTSSGAASTAAVITGTYEMAKTSPVGVFAAFLKGIPIAIVAPEFVYSPRSPFALLQIPTDSPNKTGADMNGKTIGVPALNDLNTVAAKAWVDKNGGDAKTLKFVEVPNSVMEAALQQHRIDAAVIQPPQLDATLAAGTSKTLGDGYAAISPSFYLGIFIARRDWATQHADVIRKFNRAMTESSTYVNAHPAETAPLVAELTKISLESTAKMHRALDATTLEASQLQPLIDAAAKYDMIPRGFAARDIMFVP